MTDTKENLPENENAAPEKRSLIQQMLRSARVLSFYVILGVGLLLLVKLVTQEMIDNAEKSNKLAAFNEVLPASKYDNDPLKDTKQFTNEALLGSERPVTFYRARKDGKPVGVIFEAIAPDGYSGKIKILLGVFPDGRISGVRVLHHKETPGLGDKIELRKSNWILSFNGMKLRDDNAANWRVKKDGGIFDQFTGATITPRAVVKAVRKAMKFVNQKGDKLYD